MITEIYHAPARGGIGIRPAIRQRHAEVCHRRPRYEADTVIIASGLAKGDVVVTAGINTLREGHEKPPLADAATGGRVDYS